jgi:histidinol dehydrogenase
MKVYDYSRLSETQVSDLCRRNPVDDPDLLKVCSRIFSAVEEKGDEAVREYTRRFDGAEIGESRISRTEFESALGEVSPARLGALERAASNIRKFHAAQGLREGFLEVEPGIVCWREQRPIESVGLYVPGGTAVLPSTVLMLGVPAVLAGCPRVALCTPPRRDGSVTPEVLAAASIAGISEVFRIGGAQAIAALCVGTSAVPRVDKILGPGSPVVQTAKLLAQQRGTAIDMVAGPSEVLVVADDTARPDFVAADLISQAEHGADSVAILVSPSRELIDRVDRELELRLQDLPRRPLAVEALGSGFSLRTSSLEEALEFTNRYAPEHLILQLREPKRWAARVQSAGSVFLGPWSPEVAGDYASGTNHTLPTSGLARSFSGVSLDSFVKKITFQELSREGLRSLAPTLEVMAELEQLEGHRRAVEVRIRREDAGPVQAGD